MRVVWSIILGSSLAFVGCSSSDSAPGTCTDQPLDGGGNCYKCTGNATTTACDGREVTGTSKVTISGQTTTTICCK